MGTKVKCINAKDYSGGRLDALTEGGIYEVLDQTDGFASTGGKFFIKDDRGVERWYFKQRFVVEAIEETPEAPADPSAFSAQVGGSHYKDMAIQPLEYIMANGIPFAEGNVIKYLSRWRKKNGLQDLEKGLDMMTKIVESVRNGTYQ